MNFIIRCAKVCLNRTWPVLLPGLLLSGCGRDETQSYRVPKESPAPTPAMAAAGLPAGHPDISTGAAGAAVPAAAPRLSWTKPEGWNEAPASQMRVASFGVKGDGGQKADVSVIPLPGAAGGTESNVNRWRGQVGLGSLTAEELAKAAEAVEVAGQPAQLYDVAGTATGTTEPTRILGVIQQRDGMAWFFKMTGNDPLVAKEKSAFIAFLKSVKFEASEAAASLPASHPPVGGEALPSGHPNVSTLPTTASPAASVPSSEGKPKWEVPAGWKEIAGGQFLVAKFTLTGDGGALAAVNVSMSAGDGGGLAANANRWRGQLGQSPWDAAELQKQAKELPVAGGTGTFIEMSGTDGRTGQPASLVGAMVAQAGQAWFYKLMGEGKLVESQKAAFTKFVQTVKY